jgi:hypothetical protein
MVVTKVTTPWDVFGMKTNPALAQFGASARLIPDNYDRKERNPNFVRRTTSLLLSDGFTSISLRTDGCDTHEGRDAVVADHVFLFV